MQAKPLTLCLFGSLTASPATDTIEHVFDVGDTHHLDNVPFELWQVKKGYETEIAEALENRFGDVGSKADFANAVAILSLKDGDIMANDKLSELSME